MVLDVQNPTDHDIEMSGRTVVGTLQQIQAVYPATALEKPDCCPTVSVGQVGAESEQTTL